MTAALFVSACAVAFAQDDYADYDFDFDIPAVEDNPFEYGYSIEFKPAALDLNRGSAAYRLKYESDGRSSLTSQYNLRLQFDGSYRMDDSKIVFKTNTDIDYKFSDLSHGNDLYEGYYSWTPDPSFSLDAGKKVVKWGKGYAWNPVAFIDRPKDPDDPELALEGYTLVSADYIKSYSGSLQTAALTLVALPVTGDLNPDFASTGHVNFAGKLYLLWNDTDIDVMFLGGNSMPNRAGLDFSKNLMPNLEIHGEWARVSHDDSVYIDSAGNRMRRDRAPNSSLLGLRYLDRNDITYIAEYYRNGYGFSHDEMTAFFSYADTALGTGNGADIVDAKNLSETVYGRKNLMRRYVYLKMSWKEPYDILYFTPGATAIFNVDDGSYSITPEFVYTPSTNIALRLRLSLLRGGGGTEYGEKINSNKLEFSIKKYF